MTTRIRLARGGRKNRPFYRVVVADSRSPRDGRFVERLGSYDPQKPEGKCTLDLERVNHWLSVGARPSRRVSKLLSLQGVQHKLLDLPSEELIKAKKDAADAKRKAEEDAARAEAEAKKAEEKAAAEAKKAEEKAAAEAAAAEAAAAPAEEAPAAEAPAAEPEA